MKWIFGVTLLVVLSLISVLVFNINPKKQNLVVKADAMAEMDLSNDSMEQMEDDDMEGMAMDESSDNHITGYTGIKIDARKQQLIGIKTIDVVKRPLTRLISTYGTISHDAELYAAQQEYLSAYDYYYSLAGSEGQDMVKTLLDSARKKMIILGYSDTQLKELVKRGKSDDSLVEGGASSRTWVYAQIYQKDLPYIKPGQRVQITSSEAEEKIIYGTIDSLNTVVDPETRSIRARIHTDAAIPIAHETYVNVNIEVTLGTVVALPDEAVIDSGERKIVFISMGNGYYEPREVVLGRHAAGYYEVLSGIAAGEKVVSSANFFIDSESQLKAATGNMHGMEM